MAKYFKIQSLILCVCLVLSMFTGISAFAADPLELVSWDADLDFITLDFNQTINVENADIELYADGEEVTEYTFNIQNHKSLVQSVGSSYYTYLLAPADGLEAEVVYDLVINRIETTDASTAVEGFETSFVVEVLADFDDFIPFKQQGTTRNILIKGADSFTINNATVGSYSSDYVGGIAAVIGADKEAGRHFKNVLAEPSTSGSAADSWTEGNYTFKVTYTQGAGVKTERIIVGIAKSMGTNFYNAAAYKYSGFYMEKNSTYTPSAAASNIVAQNGAGTGKDRRSLSGSNRMTGFNYEDGLEVKFAVRDGIAHGFVNGKKVFDYDSTEEIKGYPFIQVHQKSAANSETALPYAISEPVVTRCVPAMESAIDKDVVDVTDSVVVTFETAVDDSAAEKIALIDEEGNKVEGVTVTLSDDKTQATIAFTELAYRSEFFVKLGKLELEDNSSVYFPSFYIQTVEPTIELYSFAASSGDTIEGTVNVAAVIANNTQAEDFAFTATVAIYDENGKMVAVNGAAYVLATGESETIAVENFVCEDGKTYTAKCFVWDSLLGMNTIFEGVIE